MTVGRDSPRLDFVMRCCNYYTLWCVNVIRHNDLVIILTTEHGLRIGFFGGAGARFCNCILTFPDTLLSVQCPPRLRLYSTYSGVNTKFVTYLTYLLPMVFHDIQQPTSIGGGRDFDLFPDTPIEHSHYSGVIPMVFQNSGGRDFDLPRHSH